MSMISNGRLRSRRSIYNAALALVFLTGILYYTRSIRQPASTQYFPNSNAKAASNPSGDATVNGNQPPYANSRTYEKPSASSNGSSDDVTPCARLPGADDVFVILKTGATEARAKVPIHFDTTFRCTPSYAVYSDLRDDIDGHQIYDALESIPPEVRSSNPDFELHQKYAEYKKAGRQDFEKLAHSPTGVKEDAPAWKLDRWKFVEIVDRALSLKPDAKWFVFMEADTNIVWSNLLHWLARFDSKKHYYLGGQAFYGRTEFAHGGAGYILSNPAVRAASEAIQRNRKSIQKMVQEDCCGDLIIAKVLLQAEIALTEAWPMVQGETPTSLDYSGNNWCHPIISQHHMSSEEIKQMWDFEQAWIQSEPSHIPILHRDVYSHFVQPEIMSKAERKNWDNKCGDLVIDDQVGEPSESFNSDNFDPKSEVIKSASESLEKCKDACRSVPECLQYAYERRSSDDDDDGVCRLGVSIILGTESPVREDEGMTKSITSGWLTNRINSFQKGLESCEPRWITKEENSQNWLHW